STSEEDIKRAFLSATAPTDMTPIQRRPLLRLNDGRFLVLDTAFLLDKTGPGVFWTMRDFLDRKEADRAFEFRGVLLEAYAHWFWKEDYQGSGRYTPNVHFGDGAEAFDAVLIEDGVLIVLEYKSGALPAPAKHSFDEAKLVEAIGQKYVRSEKGERKGVLQLQQNIIRFLKGEELNEIGLSRSDVHTIHPMIVAVDSSLTSPLVGNHLDLKLERGVIRKLNRRIALAPLQLATFADLERLLPYTVSVSFTRMLETATKSKFQAGNFRQRARRSIEKAQSGRDIVKERWMTLTDGMRQLFPA
ncbi:MAG TPA: hypothetical protein VM120_17285, partial [Bryobacteraceae bacterium]|nr:hypothetical protein [Bryobacteraceae bacterium]